MVRRLIALALLGFTATAGADSTTTTTDLLAETDAIAAEVVALRGLALNKPLVRAALGRDDIRARVIEQIDKQYSSAEIAAEQRALVALGLLPPGVDYKALYVEVATEQIAGFYDPWRGELYVADWVELGSGIAEGRLVLAHEIDHALQDQHFDLRTFSIDAVADNDDATAARAAVVEGDGMAVMIEYMFRQLGMDPPWGHPEVMSLMDTAVASGELLGDDKFSKAPLFIQLGMTFPYLDGMKFIAHFRRHHPWSRIDAIYRKPPLSTEHILHPASYERDERPDEVKPRPVKALGKRAPLYQNTMGELGWRVLLRQHGVARDRAETAAEGWGGDRYVVYPGAAEGDADIAVLYTVWDAEVDAIELEQAAQQAGFAHVERRDDAVVIVLGAGASAPDIAAQVWKTWRVKRR